jgi:hypothetical protein
MTRQKAVQLFKQQQKIDALRGRVYTETNKLHEMTAKAEALNELILFDFQVHRVQVRNVYGRFPSHELIITPLADASEIQNISTVSTPQPGKP